VSLKRQVIALAFFSVIRSVSAAGACDATQNEGAVQACSQNPDELVRYSALLIAKRRYTEAADLLERLLMQHPDTVGAEQQYNQALAGIDDPEGFQAPRQQAAPQPWQINAGLQVRGGYGSNLNQAPSRSTVQLTLPSQTLNLELLPQFQKQEGFGVETQLTGSGVRTVHDGLQWQLVGELFNRKTDYGGYADYQGANLLTSLIHYGESGVETGATLGLNALRYDSNVYLYTAQMLLRHAGSKGTYCRPQMGVDALWQRLHGSPLLDSRYAGLMTGVLCDTQAGFYNAAISAGWDWASSQRPGGDQQRVKLEVTGIWAMDAMVQGSFIKANANLLLSDDMQPYSPLLNNNVTRYVNRTSLIMDYDWPLKQVADNWRGVATVKWQNQNSNISLFESDALEGWLGVRIVW
jgi:hypothetical protein